jgi:hypothetical protein
MNEAFQPGQQKRKAQRRQREADDIQPAAVLPNRCSTRTLS